MLTNYSRQALMKAPEVKGAWQGERCIVAATGPSLTRETIRTVRDAIGWRLICVNNAYQVFPRADALYACDWGWWQHHNFAQDFLGLKFTSTSFDVGFCDDKTQVGAEKYGITLVPATFVKGNSFGQDCLHYGNPGSSGFQAVNLALLLGASRVAMVGFDLRYVDGKSHYFGKHPDHLERCTEAGYHQMRHAFPPDDRIVNCTPGSSLTVYPVMTPEAVLANRVHRDRPESHAVAG
jgi:hypothetical protein